MKVKELEGEALDRAVGFEEGCDSAPVAYSTKWEFGEPVVISEPNYHHEAMGCGLEDRNITNRYEAMKHGWDCAIFRMLEQIPEGDLYTSDQLASAILKATKPLEEEVERLKTVPMKYRRMAFNAQLQDENKELRTQLAAAQEECEFQRNAHKQAEELMLEQSTQLAAAQEEIERLRIALDCTKTDLVRMRCPDFFEGVKGGYETLFDGHLVNMIGIINDYAKQK